MRRVGRPGSTPPHRPKPNRTRGSDPKSPDWKALVILQQVSEGCFAVLNERSRSVASSSG